MTVPNLSNWIYKIKQIAEGIYAPHGVDNRAAVGADLNKLEEDFFEAAQDIDLDRFADV